LHELHAHEVTAEVPEPRAEVSQSVERERVLPRVLREFVVVVHHQHQQEDQRLCVPIPNAFGTFHHVVGDLGHVALDGWQEIGVGERHLRVAHEIEQLEHKIAIVTLATGHHTRSLRHREAIASAGFTFACVCVRVLRRS
jgi:hypothetical protein